MSPLIVPKPIKSEVYPYYVIDKGYPRIYDINYLANEELTEDDLHHIFDNNALIYSLICTQFKIAGEYTNPRHLVDSIRKSGNWVSERHFATFADQKKFMNTCIDVIRNVYQYSEFLSRRWVEDFMIHYGFCVIPKKKKHKKH